MDLNITKVAIKHIDNILQNTKWILCEQYNKKESDIEKYPLFTIFGQDTLSKAANGYRQLSTFRNVQCLKCNNGNITFEWIINKYISVTCYYNKCHFSEKFNWNSDI